MKQLVKRLFKSLAARYDYYLISKAWVLRYAEVRKSLGQLRVSQYEADHIQRWSPLGFSVNSDTLNACYTISEQEFVDFVPEELFEAVIEKKLNLKAPLFLQHKSFYNRIFPTGWFIEDHFHKIDGVYFSSAHEPLNNNDIKEMISTLQFPVVAKGSIDTAGGRDVSFPGNASELEKALHDYDDIVIQPMLKPHPYFKQFHDFGLNTIRACLYRSVKTGKIHMLNTTLRIGKDGHLDNETQGGLVCNIHEHGKLNDYVVDKYGKRFYEHPNSKIKFADCEPLPAYQALEEISIKLAEMVPYTHLYSLDLAMDEHGEWKLIEMNLKYQTIRFAQYAGRPFFAEFTDEVIEYCAR